MSRDAGMMVHVDYLSVSTVYYELSLTDGLFTIVETEDLALVINRLFPFTSSLSLSPFLHSLLQDIYVACFNCTCCKIRCALMAGWYGLMRKEFLLHCYTVGLASNLSNKNSIHIVCLF